MIDIDEMTTMIREDLIVEDAEANQKSISTTHEAVERQKIAITRQNSRNILGHFNTHLALPDHLLLLSLLTHYPLLAKQ